MAESMKTPSLETQKVEEKQTLPAAAPSPSPPVTSSCRKKKNEEATFLEDIKDHIDEFIHSSMEDHKSCFNKTMQKMFGMSKIFAEKNAEGVESSLPLKTTASD